MRCNSKISKSTLFSSLRFNLHFSLMFNFLCHYSTNFDFWSKFFLEPELPPLTPVEPFTNQNNEGNLFQTLSSYFMVLQSAARHYGRWLRLQRLLSWSPPSTKSRPTWQLQPPCPSLKFYYDTHHPLSSDSCRPLAPLRLTGKQYLHYYNRPLNDHYKAPSDSSHRSLSSFLVLVITQPPVRHHASSHAQRTSLKELL